MNEDRFFTYMQALAISHDLENMGIGHCVAVHTIGSKWRQTYRAERPELEGVAFTLRIKESSLSMEDLQRIAGVCDKHALTFKVRAHAVNDCEGDGPELYVKIEPRTVPNG